MSDREAAEPIEWGVAESADQLDSASSWGTNEAGARHRAGKFYSYVLVSRVYGQSDDDWKAAPHE